MSGQLSDLERKSVHPIVDSAGVPACRCGRCRSPSGNLVGTKGGCATACSSAWLASAPGRHADGLIDERSFRKKGTKAPGVQRQYRASIGKRDSGIVTVPLGGGRLPLPAGRRVVLAGELVEGQSAVPTIRYSRGRGVPAEDEDCPGTARPRHELPIARNVLGPNEWKYFVAFAPRGTRVSTLLLVGFSRWRGERCLQDGKEQIGLSHCEGRRYLGLKRLDPQRRELSVPDGEGREALRETILSGRRAKSIEPPAP